MSKRTQTIIASVLILGLAALFGCSAFQDALIPCYVPPASMDYADANATSFFPWTTIFDARRIDMKMDFVHRLNQLQDNLKYGFLKGLNAFHIQAAEEMQAAIFSPEGPIGLLLPTIMGTGIGALLIKRPGDKSKKEVELEANNRKETNV
ncbi:hypothetical protein LCGC14_1636790 [marine sediment metagenome]|uniref:Uncharacterized protein n=1 Tax=marine sediment metagenome TaxID=412755 RepID=A0A0F9I0W5_9ZZZZ